MTVRRRARAGAAAWALVLAAAGCGGGGDRGPEAMDEPAVVHRTVDVDGVQRRYRLFTPPSIDDDRPLPLVLALHGSYNTPESFVDASRLDEAASAGGFVVAYPEALRLLWNAGFCCTSGRGDAAADVRFLDRVIAEIAATRPIDSARVYAVGVSAGGIMGYRMACDPAGRIAGVGSVAGTMQIDECLPPKPVSVIAIHGTGDEVVPYEGGRILGGSVRPAPPAMAVAERWAALDACPGEGEARVDGIVTTRTWDRCAEGSRVRMITIEGGGHNWFARDFGPPNGAIEATTAVLEFFGLARP